MAVKTDATITVTYTYTILFILFSLVIFFIPYWLRWKNFPVVESDTSLLLLVLACVLGVVVHEALHGVGTVIFGRVPWAAVKFGVNWKDLIPSPFTHCRVPLSSRAYRYALLLPGIALDIVPGVIGLVLGIGWATIFGSIMFVCAAKDFAVIWAIRSIPTSARVMDHPEKIGCQVLIE